MLTIVPPSMPRRFYRYRSVSTQLDGKGWTTDDKKVCREIDAIREKYLWCSRLEGFNDPAEGAFCLSPTANRDPNASQVCADVKKITHRTGICCFSDKFNHPLMWAHYAGASRGICVEYSTNDLRKGLCNVQAVRVQYERSIPVLRNEETPHKAQCAVKALSTKGYDWQYEGEWRLLAHSPGRLTIDGQSPVKCVYFGPSTEQAVIDEFKSDLGGAREGAIRLRRLTALGQDFKYLWENV
jgi:hypothetical protein